LNCVGIRILCRPHDAAIALDAAEEPQESVEVVRGCGGQPGMKKIDRQHAVDVIMLLRGSSEATRAGARVELVAKKVQ
jgi:hypothetical protein